MARLARHSKAVGQRPHKGFEGGITAEAASKDALLDYMKKHKEFHFYHFTNLVQSDAVLPWMFNWA
jgi:hypothetical protein